LIEIGAPVTIAATGTGWLHTTPILRAGDLRSLQLTYAQTSGNFDFDVVLQQSNGYTQASAEYCAFETSPLVSHQHTYSITGTGPTTFTSGFAVVLMRSMYVRVQIVNHADAVLTFTRAEGWKQP
jgi:hypothetical protein